MTNRRFTARELRVVDELNASLFTWLGVKQIISIGQDAAHYASQFGVEVKVVRHPSYGGVVDFRRGIAEAYGIAYECGDTAERQASLFSV